MRKKRHIVLWVIGVLIVLVVSLIVGAQVLVNTRWAKDKLNQILSTAIDGSVDYSRLDVSLATSFPLCRVTLDSVSLTYDHQKFAMWDSLGSRHALLLSGRGSDRDTLAYFDRLTASLNVLKLIGGRIRVKEVRLDGFDGFLHVYDTTASNLDIFLPSEKHDTDTSKAFSTPMISIGELCIPNFRAVYTDQSRSIFASASMDSLTVSGHFRFDENGEVRLRSVGIAIDSLIASARVPDDSARVSIASLRLSEPYKNVYDLGLNMLASAGISRRGEITVPAAIYGRIGMNLTEEYAKFVIPGLDGRLAHIPFHVDGNARIYADSTIVDAKASFLDCPLDTLLKEYGVKFIKAARKFNTDAHVDIEASAKGKFAGRRVPKIEASVRIPRSHVSYLPLGLDGFLALDVNGSMNSRKVLDADVNEFQAVLPGFVFNADGTGRDILSGDPLLNIVADANFSDGALAEFIPEELGITSEGSANLSVRAKGKPTQFVALDYENVSLNASFDADGLALNMPKDTISAALHRTDLKIAFGEQGSDILISMDSLSFSKGENLKLKARGMKSNGSVSNVETRGGLMPHLRLSHSDRRIALKTGNNWIIAGDVDILTSATKRGRLSDEMMARLNERMAKDSVERSKKSYRKEKDFEDKDIRIAVDTTILRYLRQWRFNADVSVGRAAVRMPSMPLRTRIGGLRASYTGDMLKIDTLSAMMGTSDIELKGQASGLRRFVRGKGDLTAELYAGSRTINANELIAAFGAGRELADSSFSESDESFVVDTLEDASLEDHHAIPLVVLPGNVSATVNVMADTVLYSDYTIHPILTRISMRERTAQMLDTKIISDLGEMNLSAYYSVRNKEDISAGVDIGIYGVSADSLIRMIPEMDSLLPVLKSFQGRLNCEVTAMTQLDTNMQVVMPTLEGVARISGQMLNIADAGDLRSVTRLLRFRDLNIGHIDDLNVNAVVHDGKIDIFPFVLGVDRYRMALHGMQDLNQSMYYHASILKSPFLMRFGINVFGKYNKWGFTLGRPKYTGNDIPDFTAQIDTMQTMIRRTIDNVFETSDKELTNSRASEQLRKKEAEIGYESGMEIPENDDSSSEEAAYEYDAMIEEEQLQAEVDEILDDSFREIADMMKDYESQIYDKKVLRKMEKLAKKSAKKNKQK